MSKASKEVENFIKRKNNKRLLELDLNYLRTGKTEREEFFWGDIYANTQIHRLIC